MSNRIICAACNKPVETATAREDLFNRRLAITVRCHGESEETYVSFDEIRFGRVPAIRAFQSKAFFPGLCEFIP